MLIEVKADILEIWAKVVKHVLYVLGMWGNQDEIIDENGRV